jgi:UDP:flavonoid glycosyltransferase YjiC (YdhE family)
VSEALRRIVIAAGGTAGHVIPALAVADALRAEGAVVTFIGGERAEAQLVPAAGSQSLGSLAAILYVPPEGSPVPRVPR